MEDRQLTRRHRRAPRCPTLALLIAFAAAPATLAGRARAADPPPPALPLPGAPTLQLPGAPALPLPGGAPAEAAPPAPSEASAPTGVDRNQVHREAVEAFAQLDADQDGRLQPIETLSLSSEVFAAADRDHDGSLSILEWVDARFTELDAATAAAPPPGAPAPPVPPGGGEPRTPEQ